MTDKELADKVVARGVGKFYGPTETQSGGFSVPRDGTEKLYVYSGYQFVRDWRVAGAMLEKMSRVELITAFLGNTTNPKWHLLDQLRDPCAIIEACVEALGE